MLVVLGILPIATPAPTLGFEGFRNWAIGKDHTRHIFRSVALFRRVPFLAAQWRRTLFPHIGVGQRVDVNRQSARVG